MGTVPMPIYVSRTHFALRYEVPKFLPREGHLCMAVLTIAEELLGSQSFICRDKSFDPTWGETHETLRHPRFPPLALL